MSTTPSALNITTNLMETNVGFVTGAITDSGVANAEEMLSLLEGDGQDPRSETALPFSFFVSSRSDSESGVLGPDDLQSLNVAVDDRKVEIGEDQILYVVLGEKDDFWELDESPICTEIGGISNHIASSDAASRLKEMFTSDFESLNSFYERVEGTRQVDDDTALWIWRTYWKGCHRSAEVELSSASEIESLKFVFGVSPCLVPGHDEMFIEEEDDDGCIDIGYFGGVYLKAVVIGDEIVSIFDQDEDRSSSGGQYMIDYRDDEDPLPQVVLFQSEP